MSEVTRILDSMAQGDPRAAEELLPLVYDELRKLAAYKMAAEPPGQTLQATALVHEAWLRIAGGDAKAWDGRRHLSGSGPIRERGCTVPCVKGRPPSLHDSIRYLREFARPHRINRQKILWLWES